MNVAHSFWNDQLQKVNFWTWSSPYCDLEDDLLTKFIE